MSGFNLEWALGFLLGAVFIVFCAAARFAGPFADRSYTTLNRYLVANGYYILPYLGVYYLLAALVLRTMEAFGPGAGGALMRIFEAPPWVAVVTMLLLPRLPLLSRVQRRFLQHARRIAGIPAEAMELRDKIRAAKWSTDEALAREIHYSLLRRGLDLGKRGSVPDDTLHGQWIRASALAHHFEHWAEDPPFAEFLRVNAVPLHNLMRRYDYLMFKSARGVEMIGDLNEMIDNSTEESGQWESLGSLVETEVYGGRASVLHPAISTTRMIIQHLRDDMEYFIKDAAMLLARLVLHHRWTEQGRVGLLRQFGIGVEPAVRPRFRSLALVFAVVLAAMLLAMSVLGTAGEARTTQHTVGIVIMVPINFVIALLCAIYPKQYFAFANTSIMGRPPYMFFLTAGLAAAALAFVVGLAMRILIHQSAAEALQEAVDKSPWLLMSFTVALMTAMLIQDGPGPAIARSWRRWWDAGVFALALGVTMLVVQVLLLWDADPDVDTDMKVRLEFLIGFALLLGGFLGFFIPARFRVTTGPAPSPEAGAQLALLAR